jgi:hypothetical protein
MIDFTPNNSVSFEVGVLFGVLWVGLGTVGFIAYLAFRAWRLRALQEHEDRYTHERATWKLSSGPSRVLHGRVSVDDGTDVAVEIDIHQTVEDHTQKSSTWHTWNETARNMTAKAFKLETEEGSIVLVEPEREVLVVDRLATEYPPSTPRKRVRAARVRHGDSVFVYGDLYEGPSGGVYRGGGGFVLRPPRNKGLLVSTEAMRERYTERVRYSWRAALGLFAALCFAQLFLGGFTLASFAGIRTTGSVTRVNEYDSHTKNGSVRHYELWADTADGFTVHDEVSGGAFAEVSRARKRGEVATVPIVRTDHLGFASFIGAPHVSLVIIVTSVVFQALGFVYVTRKYRERFAWYDRKRVVDYGGQGHWKETRANG